MKHFFASLSHHKKPLIGIGAIIVVLFVVSYVPNCFVNKVCGTPVIDAMVRSTATIVAPRGTTTAEVVDTTKSRELGLSGRKNLNGDKSMLFIFPRSGRYGFWMKDMNFPIDILWISEQGTVVYVVENAKPEDYLKDIKYINDGPDALYVLELPANRARELGIYLGVKLQISGQK